MGGRGFDCILYMLARSFVFECNHSIIFSTSLFLSFRKRCEVFALYNHKSIVLGITLQRKLTNPMMYCSRILLFYT